MPYNKTPIDVTIMNFSTNFIIQILCKSLSYPRGYQCIQQTLTEQKQNKTKIIMCVKEIHSIIPGHIPVRIIH